MYVCNRHTLLQTGLKITNRQHTRHSLFFNYQSPCVYTYLVFLTYHLPLQQEIWLAVHSRSNLIGVTYIHLSLTHSLTHWPVHNIPDAPTKRYFFTKNNSKSYEPRLENTISLPDFVYIIKWFRVEFGINKHKQIFLRLQKIAQVCRASAICSLWKI